MIISNSDMFNSKFSNLYASNDSHEYFISIYDKVCELEQSRIVQRLARPISRQNKMDIMNQVNLTLEEIRDIMDEICRHCSDLKGKQSAIVKDMYVSTHSWKTGIRKIQSKISTFYQVKMKHFKVINACSKLKLELFDVQEKEWAKACFSKMQGFCICG